MTLPDLPAFPVSRPRRLRRTPALRRLVSDVAVRPADLVLPMFVREGITDPVAVASMPGVVQHTQESLVKAAVAAVEAGGGGAGGLRRPPPPGRGRGGEPDWALCSPMDDSRASPSGMELPRRRPLGIFLAESEPAPHQSRPEINKASQRPQQPARWIRVE